MPPKQPNTHYNTPIKAKVQEMHKFLIFHNIPHDVQDIFKRFSVKNQAGYRMLEEKAFFCSWHNSDFNET